MKESVNSFSWREKMKKCIINVSYGKWYPKGQDRLSKSLLSVGYNGEKLFWRNSFPVNSPQHYEVPYAFKAFAFQEAYERGNELILWVDSSLWAIKNPNPIFDIIDKEGGYFVSNGPFAGNTIPDRALKNMNLTRDEAMTIPEITGCIMGINIKDIKGKKFLDDFLSLAKDRVTFQGSHLRSPVDSNDKRFLYARHDQPVASILRHRIGLPMYEPKQYFRYYYNDPIENDTSIFLNQGM